MVRREMDVLAEITQKLPRRKARVPHFHSLDEVRTLNFITFCIWHSTCTLHMCARL